MPKAIVIGASSGIGKELAKRLSSDGYELGLTARREELLKSLQNELPTKSTIKAFDIRQIDQARKSLEELIREMGGADLIVINSGIAPFNRKLEWDLELNTIQTNVTGCCAMANVAMKHFFERGGGHLAAISSVAALRGNPNYPAYSGSKAFLSNYLQGLRVLAHKKRCPITVTDIRPGFVYTDITKENKKMFWVASAEAAADQIHNAIKRKRSKAYVTRRWRLIAWLLEIGPDWLYEKLV